MLKKQLYRTYQRRNIPANTYYRVCVTSLLVNRSNNLHVHYCLKNCISNIRLVFAVVLLCHYTSQQLDIMYDIFTIVYIHIKNLKNETIQWMCIVPCAKVYRSSMGKHFLMLCMDKIHRCGYRHARKRTFCCCSKRANKNTISSISRMAWHSQLKFTDVMTVQGIFSRLSQT